MKQEDYTQQQAAVVFLNKADITTFCTTEDKHVISWQS